MGTVKFALLFLFCIARDVWRQQFSVLSKKTNNISVVSSHFHLYLRISALRLPTVIGIGRWLGDEWKGGPMRWGDQWYGGQWDGVPMSSNNVSGDQWVGGPMRWGTNEMGDQWADPCITCIHGRRAFAYTRIWGKLLSLREWNLTNVRQIAILGWEMIKIRQRFYYPTSHICRKHHTYLGDVLTSIREDWWLEIVTLPWNMWRKTDTINSFWPSDVIWRHISGSTLAQVMAWCLTWTNVDLPSVKSNNIHIRAI